MSVIESGFGHVLAVAQVDLGSILDGAHAAGATVLQVEDCSDLDDTDGGQVVVNGSTYAYTGDGVDDDASTVTITPGLTAAALDGDKVLLRDPLTNTTSTDWIASVSLDGTEPGDALEATVRSSLVAQLPDGLRGITGEAVELQWDEDGGLWVVDILGQPGPPIGQPGTASAQVGSTQFYQDAATATGPGDLPIALTYLPVDNSEHVYWGGLYQPGSQWTRSGQVVTLTDPGLVAGDVCTVEYAHTPGVSAPVVPLDSVTLTGASTTNDTGALTSVPLPAGAQLGDTIIVAARGSSVAVSDGRLGIVGSTGHVWWGVASTLADLTITAPGTFGAYHMIAVATFSPGASVGEVGVISGTDHTGNPFLIPSITGHVAVCAVTDGHSVVDGSSGTPAGYTTASPFKSGKAHAAITFWCDANAATSPASTVNISGGDGPWDVTVVELI